MPRRGAMSSMMQRSLYLAAYDIEEPRRLSAALAVVKRYATGGQKSAYECFLTPEERHRLIAEVQQVLDLELDRFLLASISPVTEIRVLGRAQLPADPDIYLVV